MSTIDSVQHWMLSLTPVLDEAEFAATWSPPLWAPYDRYIVFTDVNGLAANKVDENNFSLADEALSLWLAHGDQFLGAPTWAPVGDYLVYTRGTTEGCRDVSAIYMGPGEIFMDLSDGICVYKHSNLSWSPDGKRIVTDGDSDTFDWNLYILNLENKEPVQITNSSRRDACPAWSPK